MAPTDIALSSVDARRLADATPEQLVAAVAADRSLLGDPQIRERHDGLLARSSVCRLRGWMPLYR